MCVLFTQSLCADVSDSLDETCKQASCSHACVRVPSVPDKPFQCLCPDQSSKILSSNFATCDRMCTDTLPVARGGGGGGGGEHGEEKVPC